MYESMEGIVKMWACATEKHSMYFDYKFYFYFIFISFEKEL